MSDRLGVPQEWKNAAQEAAHALAVAQAITARQYPDGDAPGGLLPALVVAVAIHRATRGDQEGGRP